MKAKKEVRELNVIVHYPDSEEDMAEIRKRLARIHAQYVLNYIQNLRCPQWQKEKLLDAVIARVQAGAAVRPDNAHGAGL